MQNATEWTGLHRPNLRALEQGAAAVPLGSSISTFWKETVGSPGTLTISADRIRKKSQQCATLLNNTIWRHAPQRWLDCLHSKMLLFTIPSPWLVWFYYNTVNSNILYLFLLTKPASKTVSICITFVSIDPTGILNCIQTKSRYIVKNLNCFYLLKLQKWKQIYILISRWVTQCQKLFWSSRHDSQQN